MLCGVVDRGSRMKPLYRAVIWLLALAVLCAVAFLEYRLFIVVALIVAAIAAAKESKKKPR